MADFNDRVERQLARMAALPPAWDAEGASVIDPAIIDAVRSFLASLPEHLAPVPAIVPLSRGALQLEWHDGPRSLELEFETPGEIRYLKWHPEEGIEEEDSMPASDQDHAVELLQWFVRGLRYA